MNSEQRKCFLSAMASGFGMMKGGNHIPAVDIFLPDADCQNCKHQHGGDDGHCYMFRDSPGVKCGQFKRASR